MDFEIKPNEGKSLTVEILGTQYARIPVKTHVITSADTLEDIFVTYVKPIVLPGDIVFISEKAVSCIQSRAIPLADIRPRPLARFLCRFVYKTPYGIGLGMPETMEMALRECGTMRILFAAFIAAIGKIFGRRGWFYRIAGEKARAIDGPCDYTLPPYNEYVVLGPENPEEVAKAAAELCGCRVMVVDLNDLGQNILALSHEDIDMGLMLKILADNPLGQSSQQTPVGIIREFKEEIPE